MHEKRHSFISQREVRGDGDAIADAARAALREGPDVLVIEDLRAPEALVAALDAARAGRLVLGSISAPSAPVAIERLVDAFPAERRPEVRASLAGALRAVVAQVLVPKVAGGRTAAREVLLSSPAVRKLCSKARRGSCRSRSKADGASVCDDGGFARCAGARRRRRYRGSLRVAPDRPR